MDTYTTLKSRANAKGIKTFGDIVNTFGIDPEDIWPGEWNEDLRNEELYWCDAVTGTLEVLAQEGLI
jgi:hypothetical protein